MHCHWCCAGRGCQLHLQHHTAQLFFESNPATSSCPIAPDRNSHGKAYETNVQPHGDAVANQQTTNSSPTAVPTCLAANSTNNRLIPPPASPHSLMQATLPVSQHPPPTNLPAAAQALPLHNARLLQPTGPSPNREDASTHRQTQNRSETTTSSDCC
jgi:hypothetical protein